MPEQRRRAGAREKITPRALMELKMPGEVQVAPDGRRVAFAVSETDWDGDKVAQHLYLVLTDDEDMAPRQLTRGRSDETEPRWSPDGKWLAFLATRDDEEASDDGYESEEDDPKTQVWLLPMDGLGGEAERLTDAPEGVGAYDWLPDCSGLVYLAREPRPAPLQAAREDKKDRKDDAVVEREEKFRQQLWRIAVEDKKAKLILPGDFGVGELAVSPDGRRVAYTTNYTGEENDYHKSDVWTLELATGAAAPLTDGPGGKFHPVWARDGQSVLFTRPLDPALSYSQENLFAVSLADKSQVNLTADFPHDLTGWHGVWTDRAGTLYVSAAVGTTTGIYRRPPAGGAFEAVVQGDEHVHDFHVAPDGSLAFVASSAVDVPELLWLAPGAKDALPLTDLNADWADKYELAETEIVTYASTDGLEIEALLTLPPTPPELGAGGRHPMLVNLHGGPHGRAVQALSPFTFAQAWAAAGYAVFSPNYRGSEGYGEAFGTANRADLGGGDFRDVMAGVDWAIEEGVADPDRLGVIGSSYGGYLVNWIVTQTPRFRAAVSQFGIFSLVTDFSNSEAPRWDVEYLGGHPWEVPELYARLSPASYVGAVQTPVLLMHGESDGNTFYANSQEMYQALRLLGKPVEFVHYPREGHGFFEPQHRLDEMKRVLSWFDRHLGADGPGIYRTGDKITQGGWELTVTGASLATYAGRDDGPARRHLEVALVLRDAAERRSPLTLGPADVTLTRAGGRPMRPVGLPVDVLGQKSLAEGQGWRFAFTPGKDEPGLAAPLALTFRLPRAGGTYLLTVKDFPPVTLQVPAADAKGKPDAKKEEKKGR